MKTVLKILLTLSLITYCSISEAQKLNTFKDIGWLVGRWESEGIKGNIYEEWKLINDMLMEGKSYKIYKKDTVQQEKMILIMELREFYFISTAKDRNNGEPVCYKLIDGNTRHMEFKNIEQNNPISKKYQWKQNNRFNIESTVLLKGKTKVLEMEFKKIK